jgi:glycosyltransferase involved in cell wall biosynthesis
MKLSIVIPLYNEVALAPLVLERVEAVVLPGGVDREIVIVDDGSGDGSRQWLEAAATGDVVVVHDADLEYDPREHVRMLEPILDGRADVVFGTRFLGQTHRVLYYWHAVGNWLLTTLSNMLSNVNLTDMECCCKMFRREVLARIVLREDRFGFEPEVTAKVARLGCRIYEVPVSYSGRTSAEGKKIGWRDGFSALRCILRYNLLS